MKSDNDFGMAYLVMTNIEAEDWCAEVTEARQIIGRAPTADVRVSPRFIHISRLHAEIWRDRKNIKIRDLGSRAGTRVNGVWVKTSRESSVSTGDRIWLGGLELEVVEQVTKQAQVLAETGASVARAAVANDTIISAAHPLRCSLGALTSAELEILLWMSRGYLDDGEIGKLLYRSPNTIRTQVCSICRKLNVHSRGQCLAQLKRGPQFSGSAAHAVEQLA